MAATLDFVPAALMPFPTYRGIWVEASIQLQDAATGSPVGPNLKAVQLGAVVTVTVQVGSKSPLRFFRFLQSGETPSGARYSSSS